MNNLSLQIKDKIGGNVVLPISKSLCNRNLILKYLSNNHLSPELSKAKDSEVLSEALKNYKNQDIIDIGLAGTAMRFLTSFLCLKTEKEIVLKGNKRMNERPVADLVNALRNLGAKISYLENEGFPPLKISPSKLKGKEIWMNENVSSQFISSIMMIAPILENGLSIKFENKPISFPYILMTKSAMEKAGAKIKISNDGKSIKILSENYNINFDYLNEKDWSAASYFFSIAATVEFDELIFEGLSLPSTQGDSEIVNVFQKYFGISFLNKENSISIKKSSKSELSESIEINCIDIPDMAQTFAFLMATNKIKGKLSGLQTLVNKETNRITAIINELSKINVETESDGKNYISLVSFGEFPDKKVLFRTYDDHRMAMSLVPILLKNCKYLLEDYTVVEKSFPNFWEELGNFGIEINLV